MLNISPTDHTQIFQLSLPQFFCFICLIEIGLSQILCFQWKRRRMPHMEQVLITFWITSDNF